MPYLKKKNNFSDTQDGDDARRVLEAMVLDARYNTAASYSSKTEIYPDNLRPFVDKHMEFLSTHPDTNPAHYLANLRLMTRLQ
jgi:hypothetical protein